MRQQTPLIIGAGPAGCAAAIELGRAGHRSLLIDRDETVGDAICGGFLSWRALARLRRLGVDPHQLSAHRVDRLRLFAGERQASCKLPGPACGLSRRALDGALREAALRAGAELEIDTIRAVEHLVAQGQAGSRQHESLFLACGKHDVRGLSRSRWDEDPALGLRVRLGPDRQLQDLLAGSVELHLFRGGYAGVVLQEDGSANICLAVKKSLLASAGGDPRDLIGTLAAGSSLFAARLTEDWRAAKVDSIGAVPYGWVARRTTPGLFRLGDQAAVIPSLAGEGVDIALASGSAAAQAWQAGGAMASVAFQRGFADRAAGPLRLAGLARLVAERPLSQTAALWALRLCPGLAGQAMERMRIDAARLARGGGPP